MERQGRGLPSRSWSTLERRPSRAVRWVDSSHTTRPLPPHSCPSPSHPAAPHWPPARSPCAVHRLSHSTFCLSAPQLRQDRCPACWQAWCRQSRGPHGHRSELGGRASGLFPALPSMAVSMDSPSLHAAHSALHYISGPAWCGRSRGLWPEGGGGSIPPWAPTLGCRDPLPNPHPHPHLHLIAVSRDLSLSLSLAASPFGSGGDASGGDGGDRCGWSMLAAATDAAWAAAMGGSDHGWLMPTAWRRGRQRSGAGGDGGGGVSGGEGGGGEGERRQRPQRPQGRQCLRPAPPSSEFSPPGQLHVVVEVPRVHRV